MSPSSVCFFTAGNNMINLCLADAEAVALARLAGRLGVENVAKLTSPLAVIDGRREPDVAAEAVLGGDGMAERLGVRYFIAARGAVRPAGFFIADCRPLVRQCSGPTALSPPG